MAKQIAIIKKYLNHQHENQKKKTIPTNETKDTKKHHTPDA